VRQGVAEGAVPADRLDHYLKLRREADHLAAKQDQLAQLQEKRRGKAIHKALRQMTQD